MATIKLRDYLLALSSKGSSVDGDIITILDSADGNTIKTVLKSDLVDLDYLVSQLQDDFLDQFGEGTFSGSAQVDHDATTNFDANEHIDHTAVSIIAGAGLTGGGDISSDRTINIVSDNNGIVVNADQIELDTDSSTFSGGVLTKMNIEQVVSGSSQISADQTDGWVSDVKTQLNSNTVISGSSQVILNDADKTGFDTDDVVEGTNLYYLDSRVLSKINTEGVISGSTFSSPSQGTLTTTINGVSSNVDLGLQSGDNVTFVDGTFTGNVSINGNLDVLGDAVEIQTSELRIEDKLITVASGSADSAASDGSGLEIDGANKSLKWNHSTQQFVFDAKVSSSVGFKGEGGELTGIDTDQVTEAGNLYYTDARVKTKLNTEGVLSGSAQIASEISGSAFTSASNEFEELTLTKGDGTTTQVNLSPRKVLELVKNKESQTLLKGTPVYVSGSTGNASHIYAASASREDRMPAAYVLNQDLAFDAEGYGIVVGFINGVNTAGFNEGDVVYVGENGGYTNVKPTGNSNLIQNLGKVIKVDAVNGSGVITGAGRSNDLPNIQQGFVWVGGPSDVSYQLSTSSLLSGQGVISGSSQIDVTLTTNYSSINQYTDSDNTSHLNSLGVVSGSSQIDVTQTTNYGSINQYTDSDNLSYLNSLLVVSKSAGGDLDVNGDITASSFFIDGDTRTTGVHFANGLQHDGDGGTGIYFATDTVEVRTQNNPSLQVDSSGNTNVLFDLDVTGAITGSKLSISKDVDSQNFIGRAMIGNQNVGVGLTSDQATFSHIDHTDYQSYGFSQTNGGVTIINHPTTQYISFRNNNTEIARFDNTDYFGINTDNPLTRLHVSGSTTIEDGDLDVTGTVSGSAFRVASSGAQGIVLNPDSNDSNNSGRLFFLRTSPASSGYAIFNNSNILSFRSGSIPGNTSGVEIMRLQNNGDLTLQTGDLVIGTAGKGINFSVTSDGSGTSTSETLDDYEEGTFTPVLRDASSGGNTASVSATASYVKIGRLVTLQVSIGSIDTTGMTAGNSIYITGLPYTIASDDQTSTGACNFYNVAFGETAVAWINAAAGTDYIRILKQATGSTNSEMIVSNITSGTGEISFTISYHT